MTMEVCNDNRFELIEKYKQILMDCTNIETSPDEMKVIDNILFRFWQMGWLDLMEKQIPMKVKYITDMTWGKANKQPICPNCDYYLQQYEFIGDGLKITHCDTCGQSIDWSDEP